MKEVTFIELNEEQKEKISHMIKSPYVNFSKNNMIGMQIENNLVGVCSVVPFIDNSLSISLYIFEPYRGRGYAPLCTESIVLEFGQKYPEKTKFIYNINPQNVASKRVMEKLKWRYNPSYEEMLEEEGSEYFLIFEKENPFYGKKEIGGRRK